MLFTVPRRNGYHRRTSNTCDHWPETYVLQTLFGKSQRDRLKDHTGYEKDREELAP